MQSHSFYQVNAEHAWPIVFLSKQDCADNFSKFSSYERNRLLTQPFKAEYGDVCLINDAKGVLDKVYVGLGAGSDSMAIASVVNRLPVGCYCCEMPWSNRALLIWSLAQYRFDAYKKPTVPPRILSLNESDLNPVLLESSAVFLVRDLINRPANELNPAKLAETMLDLAQAFGANYQQWVGDELLTDNFPAIHMVGRAACVAPRLIELSFGNPNHPKVTLVGKGVCFDSGGLDLKSSASMRLMKKDMGGAAQVIGLAQWLMAYGLPIYLQVLVPAVENAVGSQSFRPGDVITMRNGLTVEVDNTDAEGRLILADALVKACESKPDLLIDFATLTGAARVAVGTELSAMFTPNDELAGELCAIGNKVNDPLWRMPLYAGYASMIESTVADLANSTASPYAGAITAALFLQRFVDESIEWVHFDVMAWNVINKPGKPEGGEAMAMQAVAHYLIRRYSDC